MTEAELRKLLDQVRHGSLPRRDFVQRMLGHGVTLPMTSLMLTQGGVAAAQPTFTYKPTKRGGGGNLRMLEFGNLGILHQQQGRMEEARSHYDQALAIHREVGNRRFEGLELGNLGNLHREQRRFQEAHAHYEQALAILREVGQRRFEGIVLRDLSDLFVQQGRINEARETLRAGEALQGEVDDRLEIAKLRCIRGRAETTAGDIDLAHSTLTEVETMANAIGAGPDSALGHEIAKLRAELA